MSVWEAKVACVRGTQGNASCVPACGAAGAHLPWPALSLRSHFLLSPPGLSPIALHSRLVLKLCCWCQHADSGRWACWAASYSISIREEQDMSQFFCFIDTCSLLRHWASVKSLFSSTVSALLFSSVAGYSPAACESLALCCVLWTGVAQLWGGGRRCRW